MLELCQVGHEDRWCNPVPNSVPYSRPLCISREKESRESIEQHYVPFFDALEAMKQEPLDIEINGKMHKLWVSK